MFQRMVRQQVADHVLLKCTSRSCAGLSDLLAEPRGRPEDDRGGRNDHAGCSSKNMLRHASTWIAPGCVQFSGRKNVFTRPGSKPEKLGASKCRPLFTQERTQVGHRVMSASLPLAEVALIRSPRRHGRALSCDGHSGSPACRNPSSYRERSSARR
jgi:hypothetical protein